MVNTKTIGIGIVLVALIIIGIGTSLYVSSTKNVEDNNGEQSKSKLELRQELYVVKYPNIQWFDPVYIADEKGWFEEEGIKIEWVGEIPAGQLVPSVASRSIDFANRHTPLALTAIAGGARLKLIAAGANTIEERPHMKYLVLDNSSIKAVKDFAGKKIGINSFGACSEYVLKEYLRRNKIESGVEFVVMPDTNMEQSLRQGLIDVGVLHSPYYEKALLSGGIRSIFSDYIVDNGLSGMLPYFTHEDFIKEHPDVVRSFVKVLAKASDWTNENHQEAGEIFAKRRGLDPKFAGSWHYYKNGIIPDDSPVQWWIDLLVREGKLKEGQIKAKDVYTNAYNPHYK